MLEPVMVVEVTAPGEFIGTILDDLSARRAQVVTVIAERSPDHDRTLISAKVPHVEMDDYPTALPTMTGGRGQYRVVSFSPGN